MRDHEHTLMSGGIGLAAVAGSPGDWGMKLAFAVLVALITRYAGRIIDAAISRVTKSPRKSDED